MTRRHTDDQQSYEKVLNIANHQVNASENHSELPAHTNQNDCY